MHNMIYVILTLVYVQTVVKYDQKGTVVMYVILTAVYVQRVVK
jgi:hypothetical protein